MAAGIHTQVFRCVQQTIFIAKNFKIYILGKISDSTASALNSENHYIQWEYENMSQPILTTGFKFFLKTYGI